MSFLLDRRLLGIPFRQRKQKQRRKRRFLQKVRKRQDPLQVKAIELRPTRLTRAGKPPAAGNQLAPLSPTK